MAHYVKKSQILSGYSSSGTHYIDQLINKEDNIITLKEFKNPMRPSNQIIALLILLHTKGVGRQKAWELIQKFGSAEKCVEAGWLPKKKLLFHAWEVGAWEEDLELVQKKGISLIAYNDENYPKNLLKSSDFPLIIYARGTLIPQDDHAIAIVGTRNATVYGKEAAVKIASDLSSFGITVVSGLARGIDTAAHQGALRGKGRTFAVIGSGLSNLYPKENEALAEEIASSGAIISEYPMKTPPGKGLFPRRNRIICGLSQGICLIESPLTGGGMLTAHIAKEKGKKIFALPGRIDWPTFVGNHALLKEGAHLIENGRDVLSHFKTLQIKECEKKQPLSLSEDDRAFLDKLPIEEKSIEELVLLTQLPIMQLNILLTRFVLKKLIKEFPGKIYKKIY